MRMDEREGEEPFGGGPFERASVFGLSDWTAKAPGTRGLHRR